MILGKEIAVSLEETHVGHVVLHRTLIDALRRGGIIGIRHIGHFLIAVCTRAVSDFAKFMQAVKLHAGETGKQLALVEVQVIETGRDAADKRNARMVHRLDCAQRVHRDRHTRGEQFVADFAKEPLDRDALGGIVGADDRAVHVDGAERIVQHRAGNPVLRNRPESDRVAALGENLRQKPGGEGRALNQKKIRFLRLDFPERLICIIRNDDLFPVNVKLGVQTDQKSGQIVRGLVIPALFVAGKAQLAQADHRNLQQKILPLSIY